MTAINLSVKNWLPQFLNAVKESLFPARCIACGHFYQVPADQCRRPGRLFDCQDPSTGAQTEIFKWALGSFVCPECSNSFSPVSSPICSRCGLMFNSRQGNDHHCGECLEKPGRFRKARSFGVYDRTLMEAIHRLKYKGKVQLARPLGTLLLVALGTYWRTDPPDLVVPVPLHTDRMRKRGFNQAYLMVRDWPRTAAALSIKIPDTAVERELLVRTRSTQPQTGLGRRIRLQNIKKAFDVRDRARVLQKKILLVDDVYTTGATVDECAGVLMEAGALWVDVLTLARTM